MSAVPIILSDPQSDDISSSAPGWGIYLNGSTSQAIVPDTFVAVEPRSEERVSDYPVEQGAFASYNKVQMPSEIRATIACGGEQMSRADFLAQLKSMLESINLYDIATPDQLFESYTLVRTNYQRRANKGVSLIVVECIFEQVRQTAQASYSQSSANGTPTVNSDSPSANDPESTGQVSPDDLQPSQTGAVGGGGIL